jgi:hypothetical protein
MPSIQPRTGEFGRAFVVSLDPAPRKMGDILVLPWREFCRRLWAGEIV